MREVGIDVKFVSNKTTRRGRERMRQWKNPYNNQKKENLSIERRKKGKFRIALVKKKLNFES
jgi:hypothetical protein